MVFVKNHKRKLKIFGTPDERKKIKAGLKLMKRYGWDKYLPNICVIKALNAVSHNAGPYTEGACSEINIEPADLNHDALETGLTITHEAIHAKAIAERGTDALQKEDEIEAHEETKQLLEEAIKIEQGPAEMGRLNEELIETDEYIAEYKRKKDGGT